MYPLNMKTDVGFAVANDEAEHIALTGAGYEPAFVPPDTDPEESDAEGHTVTSARAALDAVGIQYDKRLGLAKLLSLLPA